MIKIGTHCRISPAGDRYDNIRCVVVSISEVGAYHIEFLEAIVDHEIGYIGIFGTHDLIPISPLELLAEAAE